MLNIDITTTRHPYVAKIGYFELLTQPVVYRISHDTLL